jgi:outer membrane protein TolC
MKNTKISLIILLIISAFTISAQENIRMLSLQDVINLAKKQSPDALMAKHRFRSSFWEFKTFKAEYLPQLILNGTLPSLDKGIRKQEINGETKYFTYNTSYEMLNLSLNQEIGITGGTLSVYSKLSRDQDFLNDTSGFLALPINIQYIQPLFQYNNYKWAKKIEPLKYLESKSKYIEEVEQVSITAVNHFFNLLLAHIEKKIAYKNRSNYDTLYHIALGRFNLGKIAENELLQLELNLLRAKSSVETAELNLENSMFTFKSFLRIKDDEKINLVPPLNTLHFDVPVQKAIDEAKKNSSTGLDFEKRLLQAASEMNKAKLENRFDANLFANYGLNQSGLYFADAYKSPLDQQQLTLGITIPILDWGLAKGKMKLAESKQELVITSIEQERIDFEQSIYLNVMQFNMQKNQLFIAAKSDTVAQKRYKITQQRYLIGKVNDVLELNNAQIDSDRSQKEYSRALQSYWRNYFELRKLTLYDFEKDRIILFDINEIQE